MSRGKDSAGLSVKAVVGTLCSRVAEEDALYRSIIELVIAVWSQPREAETTKDL